MTEYDSAVERQRILLEAEAWADSPKSILIHQTTSMWYETEDSKRDFENGSVTDTQYNSGLIERTQNGKLIRTFGYRATGDELVDIYIRGGK